LPQSPTSPEAPRVRSASQSQIWARHLCHILQAQLHSDFSLAPSIPHSLGPSPSHPPPVPLTLSLSGEALTHISEFVLMLYLFFTYGLTYALLRLSMA
jgi:hypothetical protein